MRINNFTVQNLFGFISLSLFLFQADEVEDKRDEAKERENERKEVKDETGEEKEE